MYISSILLLLINSGPTCTFLPSYTNLNTLDFSPSNAHNNISFDRVITAARHEFYFDTIYICMAYYNNMSAVALPTVKCFWD